MKSKDVLLVALSDMHSGSNTALFPNRFVRFKNGGSHTPNGKQELIYAQFQKMMDEVKKAREGKRVILVNDGDAIEGLHHTSMDVCIRDVEEQAALHTELMNVFMRGIKWQRGDLLYYVRGTETHTTEKEQTMAEQVGAVQHPDGAYVADHLELSINGRLAWFVHEGAKAGKGANEGNGLRNWLRDIYYDALKDGISPPDAVYSGHVHKHTHQIYVAMDKGQPRPIHGTILPSWQAKTRFGYKVASIDKNSLGGMMQLYTASGDIRPPYFSFTVIESMVRG